MAQKQPANKSPLNMKKKAAATPEPQKEAAPTEAEMQQVFEEAQKKGEELIANENQEPASDPETTGGCPGPADETPTTSAPPDKAPENPPATGGVQNRALITASEKGYLEASTLEGRFRVADAMFKGRMVPKAYTSSAQVFAAMEYGAQLGLRPMVAIQKIAVVNGSPALWGEMPLAMALDKGMLVWHKTFLIDETYLEICKDNKNLDKEPFAAVTQGIRKGKHYEKMGIQERFFTRAMAEAAGLPKKTNTPWGQGYDWRMMMWRAQQMFVKDIVPDAIYGIPMAESDFNTTFTEGGQSRDVTPNNGEPTAADTMRNLMNAEKEKAKSENAKTPA